METFEEDVISELDRTGVWDNHPEENNDLKENYELKSDQTKEPQNLIPLSQLTPLPYDSLEDEEFELHQEATLYLRKSRL